MKLQGMKAHQSRGFSDPERKAMSAALKVAAHGIRGANPLVGAVILNRAGTVLGTGHHRGAGTPHAERDAISDARIRGSKIEGATMVVTLEPCNHTGRTAPCTDAIIEAGISRIIYAVHDISHTAAGGSETLRGAGIDVQAGLLEDEAARLNRRWFDAVGTARPFTTLRVAQSLDAQIAATDGTSQWISGPESRRDSHQLRGRVDAILVGTGTVLADNPRLTARNQDGAPAASQPLRVVMGYREPPADAAVRNGGPGGFVHYSSHDPRHVGTELHSRGVRHLMIEGGSKVSSAFLAAGLVDEIIIYVAPTFLGRGIPALADLGITSLSQAQHWDWDFVGCGFAVPLGRDLRLQLEPATQQNG